MDVITFLDHKKTAKVQRIPFIYPKKRKTPKVFASTHHAIQYFAEVSSSEFPELTQDVHSHTLRRILAVLVVLLFVSTFGMFAGIPSLKTSFKWYTLKHIQFVDEPSLVKSLRKTVFPSDDDIDIETALKGSIPEILSGVSYQTYTVKKGDTIGEIAYRFGKSQGSILSVNHIPNARRIQVGNKLKIPSMNGIVHTVVKGDTLDSLAKEYNLTVANILDANDLSNSILTVGMEMFLPGAVLSTFDLRKAMGELFLYPIRGRLTSPFGYRADPFSGKKSFHTGIDLAAPTGTPIRATLDGRVAEAGYSRVYGYYVIISHGGHYQSLYGHMSKIYVYRGQYILQGGTIGTVGSTGRSTGPHVHFSIYKYGKLVNPLSLLK